MLHALFHFSTSLACHIRYIFPRRVEWIQIPQQAPWYWDQNRPMTSLAASADNPQVIRIFMSYWGETNATTSMKHLVLNISRICNMFAHFIISQNWYYAGNWSSDVIMSAMAPQITSLTIAYSTVYSRRRSKKHQSSASRAFVRGIHRWPVNSQDKGPVIWKYFHLMTSSWFPCHDVSMLKALYFQCFSV